MADLLGPSLGADSWSCTEVKYQKHVHSWTVKGFSQCDCRYLETMVKPLPNDPGLVFRIRLHPQGNKESNKDFTFFQVFCSNLQSRHRAKFTVNNSRNEEIATTIYTGQQQLHGYFEYIRRDTLLGHLLPADELVLLLELVVTFETVTKSFHTRQPQIEPKQYEVIYSARTAGDAHVDDARTSELAHTSQVAKDLKTLYNESKMTDFTIACTGHDILCHKAILAARSPVFSAMLEPHTDEAKESLVTIDDVEYEVMNEMLYYIYTGTSPNLKEMAADLLAVADRFQLLGLKEMADQVLRHNLNIENSCRILVLADMHGATELKQEAVRYVAQHKSQVIQTDGWSQMITVNPNLVTEIVSAIQADHQASNGGSPTFSSSEPATKRFRSGTMS